MFDKQDLARPITPSPSQRRYTSVLSTLAHMLDRYSVAATVSKDSQPIYPMVLIEPAETPVCTSQ